MAAPPAFEPDGDLVVENGRGYGSYHYGQYFMPADSKEQERLDIMHTMILAARPRPFRLHHAPFVERQNARGEWPRVLDLGHGTAIWLLDMAEKYTNTEFIGMDLAKMAPNALYRNIDVGQPADYEGIWALGENSFDFIHLQMGLGSVRSWPNLYEKIYRHLKPGSWFEHVELDWQPQSEQNRLPPGKYYDWWHRYIKDPYNVIQRSIEYSDHHIDGLLRQAGFVPGTIRHDYFRIPTNGWSGRKEEHVAGTWWENAMASGEGRGHGFEALSLKVLTQVQGWPAEHARKLCEDAMLEAANPAYRPYNVLHVWCAQKPDNPSR